MMKKSIPAPDPKSYLAALDGWRLVTVKKLRKAVLSAAPFVETIKWGHLVYFSNGPALLIRAEEERVLFGFWRGKRMMSLEPRLKPGGKFEMATIVLTPQTKITAADAAALAKKSAALNVRFGDPTNGVIRAVPACSGEIRRREKKQ